MQNPSGRTALIVEDELLIVLEIEDVIASIGNVETHARSDVAGAMAWLETNIPNFAVIDYRLRDTTSESLVRRLTELGVPTLIYSGREYVAGVDDPILEAFTWLAKPADPEVFREKLIAMVHKTNIS